MQVPLAPTDFRLCAALVRLAKVLAFVLYQTLLAMNQHNTKALIGLALAIALVVLLEHPVASPYMARTLIALNAINVVLDLADRF